MALELYRRHTVKCPHRGKGQNYTKCSCPIWCDGERNGKRDRRSMKTRDWERAIKRRKKLESGPEAAAPVRTVKEAFESYLADCRARKLAESTVTSYRKTLDHLQAFCDGAQIRHVDQLDLGALGDFRASRPVAASTSGKELETLRAFCAFAKKRGWIAENYAKDLKAPREDGPPTMPFTDGEVKAILDACGRMKDQNRFSRERSRARAKGMILTMLYSGMRISDTIGLKREAVNLASGKLRLRVMKTGVPLYVRLQAPAVKALAALPVQGDYFFWSGESKLSTAIGAARRTIDRVLKAAKVEGGHPHRFRDTFSVRLLEAGEPLRTVQLLLGHESSKTTEKHYAPFVKSFQTMLDSATSKLDFGTNSGTLPKKAAKLLKMKG